MESNENWLTSSDGSFASSLIGEADMRFGLDRRVVTRLLAAVGLVVVTGLCMWPSAVAVVTTSPTNPEPLKESQVRWVKIGLALTPYKSVRKKKSGKETKSVMDKTESYTLRAKLNKSNHFYLGDYHVQTTPLFLEPHSGRYAVKLRVYGKFGALGQVEEEIGSLDVDGVLSGKGPIYTLKGAAQDKFYNKLGKPLLVVRAGLGRPQKMAAGRKKKRLRRVVWNRGQTRL